MTKEAAPIPTRQRAVRMEKEFKLGLDCGATVVMGPVVEESKLVRRSFGGGLGTNCRSVSSLVKDWETHPGIA